MSKWDKESSLPKPPEIEMLLVFYPGRLVKLNRLYEYRVIEIALDSNVRCAPIYLPDDASSIFYPQFIAVSDDDGATWYEPFGVWK